MIHTNSRLTVLFEEPFWVVIYERQFDSKYEVCKVTFGAEPTNDEVYVFFLENWKDLRFSAAIDSLPIEEKQINPKRMQRKIRRQLQNTGIGTKAQNALKLQHEQTKSERKTYSHQQRETEKERQFLLRQEKRKEKHRGH